MAAAEGKLEKDNGSKNNLFKRDSDDILKMEEEEYMIAADLTLYSNPLNRALGVSSEPSPPTQRKPSRQKAEKEEERETIAADLTKYDSPMAELDHLHAAKQVQKQQLKQQKQQHDIRKKSKS